MSNLYTASEAREKLGGIAPAILQRFVDAGKIQKVLPPGNKKRGLYNKEDVDKLAEAIQEFIELHDIAPKVDRIEFVQAQTETDIKATVQIARQLLGDNAYGMEKRMLWFNKAPRGDYVLKHNGIIVGYFSMQAIKQEAIEDVFNQRSGRSIQLEDMEPILPENPLELHISGIGVKKGISRNDAKKYGMELLRGIFETFVELGKQGIDIRKIWAKSSTVTGMKLGQDLQLTGLGYINDEQIGFLLEVDSTKAGKPILKKYIQLYQQALAEWKKEQSKQHRQIRTRKPTASTIGAE